MLDVDMRDLLLGRNKYVVGFSNNMYSVVADVVETTPLVNIKSHDPATKEFYEEFYRNSIRTAVFARVQRTAVHKCISHRFCVFSP